MMFMSAIYAQPLPEATCMICTACKEPAVDGRLIAAMTNHALHWRAYLNLSLLRFGCQPCTLDSSLALPTKYTRTFIYGKYLNAHSMVYGHKQTDIHKTYASVGLTQAHPKLVITLSAHVLLVLSMP